MPITPGLNLPFGIQPVNPVPVDANYGPYVDIAEAVAAIPLALRYDGLTVQITGSGNYWWLDGDLSDTGLISKGGGASGLPTVLSLDNTTGTNDISINTSQAIVSGNGGGQLNLDYGGSPGTVVLSTDNGALGETWLQLSDMQSGLFWNGGSLNNLGSIFMDSTSGMNLIMNGSSIQLTQIGHPLGECVLIAGSDRIQLSASELDINFVGTITEYSTDFIGLYTNSYGVTAQGSSIDFVTQANGSDITLSAQGLGANIVLSPENKVIINDALQYIDGTEGAGKVLISDASGNATWQNLPSGSNAPVSILWADLLVLYNAGTMSAGTTYFVTDAGQELLTYSLSAHALVPDKGLYIKAESATSLALEGTGIFLNADYAGIGDYSGVSAFTGVPYTGINHGVWYLGDEGTYVDGDIVIYGGRHFQATDLSITNGLPPYDYMTVTSNPAYTLLPKTEVNVGYIESADLVNYIIFFDGLYDYISYREDKLGNKMVSSAIWGFQWGNPNVTNNIGLNGVFNITNTRADQFSDVTLLTAGAGITSTNECLGSIYYVVVSNTEHTINVADGEAFAYANLGSVTTGINALRQDRSYGDIHLYDNYSNIIETFDITGDTILDIDGDYQISHTGTAYLTSTNSTEILSEIRHYGPQPLIIRPKSGLILTIQNGNGNFGNAPKLIGGASIVLDSANDDWIELEYDEDSDTVYQIHGSNLTISGTTQILSSDDKFMVANTTSGDDQLATNATITNTPVDGCYVAVMYNGVEYEVGNGDVTKVFYFSNVGGGTARGFSSSHPNGQVQTGDNLYFNESVAGFALTSGARISLMYMISN